MSDTTESPKVFEGWKVKLIGTNYSKIASKVSSLSDNRDYYDTISKAVNPG